MKLCDFVVMTTTRIQVLVRGREKKTHRHGLKEDGGGIGESEKDMDRGMYTWLQRDHGGRGRKRHTYMDRGTYTWLQRDHGGRGRKRHTYMDRGMYTWLQRDHGG